MNITSVKITKLEDAGKCKGLASITIEDCFVVTGIRIMGGNNGLFIAMPSRKIPNGEYRDICFPVTAEARTKIQDAIINKYNEEEPVQDEFPSFGDDLPF